MNSICFICDDCGHIWDIDFGSTLDCGMCGGVGEELVVDVEDDERDEAADRRFDLAEGK